MLKISKLIIILLFCNGFHTIGQYSRLAYFMDIPQNRFLNPAIRPVDSLYIGLPVVSGAGFSIDNNFLRYHDLFIKRNDSVITINEPGFDPGRLLAHSRNRNLFEADGFVQLFGISFMARNGFILIDVNDRLGMHGRVPASAVLLGVIDPAQNIGEVFDFSDAQAGLFYYREFGLGYSWNPITGLRTGVKMKFLAGMGSIYSDITNWQLQLNEPGYYITSAIDANVSAPLKINYDNNGQIDEVDLRRRESINTILMRRGVKPGIAFDIGATWQADERISISASLTDLGFIRWGKDNSTFRINESFGFRSIDVTVPGGDNSINAIGDRFLDSIQNHATINVLHYPFTEIIPASLYAGAEFSLTEYVSLGLISRTRFITGNVKESVSLSANLNRNRFSATVAYTAANRVFNNIGAAMAFRVGPFQFYIISDRIPFRWTRVDTGDSTIPVPEQWNTFDLRAGVNLLFREAYKKRGIDCVFPYRNEISSKHKRRSGFL